MAERSTACPIEKLPLIILPGLPYGSRLGCSVGRAHHAFWYFSGRAGGRYICRACFPGYAKRYVRWVTLFGELVQPRGFGPNREGKLQVFR